MSNSTDFKLRFTPYAWAKLLYMRDICPLEVGAFGIVNLLAPLCVVDIAVIKQEVTCVSTRFDDIAVADFFEDQFDLGRQPWQYARVWIHTHPGMSPMPSRTDEETFARVFGDCDFSVMFILSSNGKFYARTRLVEALEFNFQVSMEVDYSYAFQASDHAGWRDEYNKNVRLLKPKTPKVPTWPGGKTQMLANPEIFEFDSVALERETIERMSGK